MHAALTLARRAFYRAGDAFFPAIADPLWRRRVLGKVRCLLYHRVGTAGEFPFLDAWGGAPLEPAALAMDLAFLQRQGAQFLTLSDLREGRFPGSREFGVIISFDDGTRDVYERGLPVLEDYGIRGVVFQISSTVESNRLLWEHQLYRIWSDPRQRLCLCQALGIEGSDAGRSVWNDRLNRIRRLAPSPQLTEALEHLQSSRSGDVERVLAGRLNPTGEQLRAAARSGHEIGSHGYLHYMRGGLDDLQFERELEHSKRDLERILERPIHSYSHPFNSYLPADSLIAARYYSQVARVDGLPIERNTPAMEIPRINRPGSLPNARRWRRWVWTGG